MSIDVLAVMGQCANWPGLPGSSYKKNMREARDAVYELIEAAKEVAETLHDFDPPVGVLAGTNAGLRDIRRSLARLDAALARCGGVP